MQKAKKIMPNSKVKLWMILIPNKGRLDKNKGSNAQWIAQAKEVVIPNASQLIFNPDILQIYSHATMLQIICYYCRELFKRVQGLTLQHKQQYE